MVGNITSFKPGQTGNPGGVPRNGAASQLARRYYVDAIRALVEVVRLPARGQHIGAKVTAAVKLVEFGFPGLARGASEDPALLQMHLLAVQQIVPPDHNDVLNPLPEEDDAVFALADRPGMLPAPGADLPDTALPLWDAYRVHRAAEADDIDPATPPQGWEPLPWKDT